MATKDRRKLQHIHSSIPDKQPTPQSLEVGEIAVNNSADKEFLSLKNSNDKVVRFSSDSTLIDWIERKEVMPYSGYTRGSNGPDGAIGPDSVTNDDLLNNKSNIIIRLNQVAASATTKHDAVNGAKDIYGLDVNPTTDGGVTDGAGFAIDMSRYAMIGANPSFSSVTVTHQSNLSGTTNISNGAGGEVLNITTTNVNANDTNWTETITNKKSTISTEEDKIGTLNESATTRTTTVGTEQLTVSGTTTEVHTGNVTITNSANVSATTNGTTTETKVGNVTENNSANKQENTTGTHKLYTTGDTCINSQANANFYGKGSTNIGVACDGTKGSATTVYGTTTTISGNTTNVTGATTLNINGNTINETGKTVNISASTNVNISADTICESAKTEADFYAPKTQIGVSCNGSTATTVNISGTTINEGGTNLNQNVTNYDLNGAVICISGSTNSNFYGKETNIGVDCGGTTATTVNVSGTTINEGGTTNNNTFTTVNNTATTINNSTTNYNVTGTSNVNVYGGDICISGGSEASLGAKTVKIGTDCGNNTIASGITINATSSVTVNAPTTIVTGDTYISGDTFISGDTTVDRDLIINIPCDSITSTTVNDALCEIMGRGVITMTRDSDPEDTRLAAVYKLFQDGEQIGYDINVPKDGFLKSVELVPVENVFYLRFTWYVYDADTKTYTTASTDVNVEDLVKDIEANNTKTTNRGATVDVWYNTTTKKMNVSADTVINLVAAANAGSERKNGQHYLSASTLTFSGGTFSPGTHNAFGNGKTINIPTSTDDITNNLKYLKWSLGTPSADETGYNGSTEKTITIPSCVQDLNRHKITFQSGATSGFSTSQTYDPGNDCANSAETLNIPTSVCHLNRGKSTISHNGVSAEVVSYDCSNDTKTFTHDNLTFKFADASAQSSDIVYNTNGAKEVKIPTKITHLGDIKDLTISYGNIYAASTAEKATTYNPKTAATITIADSLANVSNNHVKDTSPTNANGEIQIDKNVTVTGSVSASLGFFQTSDERMKKFISPIDNDDFNKSANVFLRSFSMNDDETNRKMYGVIAQEVESAGLEEIVHTDENGYKTVDYTSLLILKLGYLDRMCSYLNRRIVELEEKLNNKE